MGPAADARGDQAAREGGADIVDVLREPPLGLADKTGDQAMAAQVPGTSSSRRESNRLAGGAAQRERPLPRGMHRAVPAVPRNPCHGSHPVSPQLTLSAAQSALADEYGCRSRPGRQN